MRPFFLVLARNGKFVKEKIRELDSMNVPYIIVCGDRIEHQRVVHRAPSGKYDAINYGARLVPRDVDIVVMNDVDTRIHNFRIALSNFEERKPGILFSTEMVQSGPQRLFLRLLNSIRRKIPLVASGELMLINRDLLENIVPLRPCKGEDTYILFKALELGQEVIFCQACYAETERTKTPEQEELYKRRTVTGIYQALSYTMPPFLIRLFYMMLPFASPLLLILGRKGFYWTKGILLGLLDYVRGDRSGSWQATYL